MKKMFVGFMLLMLLTTQVQIKSVNEEAKDSKMSLTNEQSKPTTTQETIKKENGDSLAWIKGTNHDPGTALTFVLAKGMIEGIPSMLTTIGTLALVAAMGAVSTTILFGCACFCGCRKLYRHLKNN
jgi:hypothetical protein